MMQAYDDYEFNSILIKSYKPNGDIVKKANAEKLKYHYTSPDAFLSILKEGKIHFTDIRYFNDKMENMYIVKCILDFLNKNPGKHETLRKTVNRCIITDHVLIQKSETLSLEYRISSKFEEPRKFVFCTSTEADSLCMWNYYVKNGVYQGYNIGFDIEHLLRSFDTEYKNQIDPFTVIYGDIIYDDKSQSAEIERLAGALENCFYRTGDVDEVDLHFMRFIHRYGAFFKSKKFSHEKEYRIVIEINEQRLLENTEQFFGQNNKLLEYDFFIRNGIVVPYLRVTINKEAISRIYISPMMEKEIAQKSIKDLLKQKGYSGVSLYHSGIPIRF